VMFSWSDSGQTVDLVCRQMPERLW
jgi:hypothetical protein